MDTAENGPYGDEDSVQILRKYKKLMVLRKMLRATLQKLVNMPSCIE